MRPVVIPPCLLSCSRGVSFPSHCHCNESPTHSLTQVFFHGMDLGHTQLLTQECTCSWLLMCTAWIPSAALASTLALHWSALRPCFATLEAQTLLRHLSLCHAHKQQRRGLILSQRVPLFSGCLLVGSLGVQHLCLQGSLRVLGALLVPQA